MRVKGDYNHRNNKEKISQKPKMEKSFEKA